MNRAAWVAALLVSASAAMGGAVASCASDPGFLVVALSTNLQTPKDVDAFAVLVAVDGQVKYDYVGVVPPSGTMTLPATLVVEQPKDAGAEVHVRVVAFHHGDARVVRDVLTTVPNGRGALLRVAIDYLDDGSARGSLPAQFTAPGVQSGPIAASDFDPQSIVSQCDFTQRLTSIAGACVSAVIDSSGLPDYDPSEVFPAGPCFDSASCFAGAAPPASIDPATCVAAFAPSAGGIPTFALLTKDGTGACADAAHCYVPLDTSGMDGTITDALTARFVPAVCARLAAGAQLVATDRCAKTSATPLCMPGGGSAGTDGGDATVPEGGLPETGPKEAGVDCSALLARILSAATVPPAIYGGIDLSNDGGSTGAFGSGGATINQGDLISCANVVEPNDADAASVVEPGYRQAEFAVPGLSGAPLVIAFNRESRVIYNLSLAAGYTGSVAFHSRQGGTYGAHTYSMTVSDVLGKGGVVQRDGKDFLASFTDDAGTPTPGTYRPWVNEIYDGLMATFMPTAPAVTDCTRTQSRVYYPGSVLPELETDCLVASSDSAWTTAIVGVRPLHFYFELRTAAGGVDNIYTFWLGGVTWCNTPHANEERMEWESMLQKLARLPDGGSMIGFSLGGISSVPGVLNPVGLTEVEADGVECSGVPITAPDPGYSMVQWGKSGELAMEYNPSTGVNYKLFARKGYLATFGSANTWLDDGGVGDLYSFGIGTFTRNGAAITIDWTSVASATPTITAFANAWYESACGLDPLPDCITSGDCTITPDDGAGRSTFVLAASDTMIANCGLPIEPVGFAFDKGTSNLVELYIQNPGGK